MITPKGAESKKPSVVLWQGCNEDMCPEPALAFKLYSGMVEIQQGDRGILINLESIPAVCRILKMVQREKE
jgi:hypothetical protein